MSEEKNAVRVKIHSYAKTFKLTGNQLQIERDENYIFISEKDEDDKGPPRSIIAIYPKESVQFVAFEEKYQIA